MKKILFANPLKVGITMLLLAACNMLYAQQFSLKASATVSKSVTNSMEIRYYTELLGVSDNKGIERQFGPLRNTDITTVVCAPMAWRFYNYPSQVDLTWKEPNKFPRDTDKYRAWGNMVRNLQNGGDPLKDALSYTRSLGKRFVVSIRMNDHHHISEPLFPTHNNFYRAHPEYMLGNAKGKALNDQSALFNYLIPEVRNFYLAIMREMCTKYDVDGIELDFQRAPKYFYKKDVAQGRIVMNNYIAQIRGMLDSVGRAKNKRLKLGIRALETVKANNSLGLDVLNWDKMGWVDEITVSPNYYHTNDVGLEEFVTNRKNARIYGELNYVNAQKANDEFSTSTQNRRYVTIETYRASILSFLERGADGISFFNTYTIPAAPMKNLSRNLFANLKNLDSLKQSDKDYTTYQDTKNMFAKIFPAKNQASYTLFVADQLPGKFKDAVIRFETQDPSSDLSLAAWINGVQLKELQTTGTELFTPLISNNASAKKEFVRFFSIPISALKFGVNSIQVKNNSAPNKQCTFISSELGLYLQPAQL